MGSLPPPTRRVAMVTGGAQGLGESIALRLADDSVDIALLDIAPKEAQLSNVVKKINAKGSRAIYILADVTNEAQVQYAIERCVEELGGLDIVSCHRFKPEYPSSPLIPSLILMLLDGGERWDTPPWDITGQ